VPSRSECCWLRQPFSAMSYRSCLLSNLKNRRSQHSVQRASQRGTAAASTCLDIASAPAVTIADKWHERMRRDMILAAPTRPLDTQVTAALRYCLVEVSARPALVQVSDLQGGCAVRPRIGVCALIGRDTCYGGTVKTDRTGVLSVLAVPAKPACVRIVGLESFKPTHAGMLAGWIR